MKNNKLYSFCIIASLILIFSCQKKTPIIIKEEKQKLVDPRPISAILTENNHLPIADRIDMYQRLKSEKGITNDLEENMNMYGYNLMWSGNTKEAIEIFKLIVSDFPNSANAYDSLAESYLNDGQNDLSLINYEKAVSMDPDNYNAVDQIEKIKFPDRKQLTPEEKFSKQYTKEEYRNDLDQLLETLLRIHPNALKFTTKSEFDKLIVTKKSELTDKTTYAEFAWICSEVVANINCSHTNSGGFWPENQMLPNSNRFPLETRIIDNSLYVTNPFNNEDQVKTKDKIISINGTLVEELIQEIYKHIESQGHIETSKRHKFNRFSTGLISYGLGLPESYEVMLDGRESPIILKPSERNNDPQRDRSKVYCGGDLCLDFLDTDKKLAIMTISSFNYYDWNNFDVFKRFIDEGMNEMNDHSTEKLIIDVRGNGGGSPESSIYLLRHLIKETFVYTSRAEYKGKTEMSEAEKPVDPIEGGFDGQLYFIIDGEGNSTTGHFMSMVKKYKLGDIIGEELGSNQFCSAGQKRSRLSNTKLEYYIADNTHVSTATDLPDEVGILPDFTIIQSIDDFVDGKDVVRSFAIDHATNGISWKETSGYHSSYFLDAPEDWPKELFRIPLNFAPGVNLRGIEDARFTNGWREPENEIFWSYVFAWNVKHPQMLSTSEIETNLEKYFNGLMRIEERGKEAGIPESKAKFILHYSTTDTSHYTGTIKTLDGFFERKPLTFNVKADQQYCPEIGRAVIKFQFSPQPFESAVWDELNKVTIVKDICEK